MLIAPLGQLSMQRWARHPLQAAVTCIPSTGHSSQAIGSTPTTYYLGGDVHYPLRRELIIIGQLRHFPKHIVFHLLNEGIKQQRHIISPFECKTF